MTADKRIILSIKDLQLGYTPQNHLLESVNTTVKTGEMVALVGRNGSGKSTLLRTISGLQSSLKGNVLLDGKPFREYYSGEQASMISFSGTISKLTENLTVFEMVSLGRHPYTNWWGSLRQKDTDKIIESIRFVGMEQFTNSRLEKLSDGERQRVMIAASLAQDTKIVVLDEPTAYLDIPNRIEIAEVLFRLKKAGRSVIFSTHDFDIALTYADKLWVIHDKKLVEGAPEDLGIEHIYEKIFLKSDVDFDRKNMRFVRKRLNTKAIYIRPFKDVQVFYWTTRALQRIGYNVLAKDPGNTPFLIIGQTAREFMWILEEKDNRNEFNSLYDLMCHLTQFD